MATYTSIKPTLQMGVRKTNYQGLLATIETGTLVNTSGAVIAGAKYPLIYKTKHGTRTLSPELTYHEMGMEQGLQVKKSYTGISTVGIGYKPTVIDDEQKPIRRWPRDWHGDNMKN